MLGWQIRSLTIVHETNCPGRIYGRFLRLWSWRSPIWRQRANIPLSINLEIQPTPIALSLTPPKVPLKGSSLFEMNWPGLWERKAINPRHCCLSFPGERQIYLLFSGTCGSLSYLEIIWLYHRGTKGWKEVMLQRFISGGKLRQRWTSCILFTLDPLSPLWPWIRHLILFKPSSFFPLKQFKR